MINIFIFNTINFSKSDIQIEVVIENVLGV